MASIRKILVKLNWLVFLSGVWQSGVAEVILDGSMGPAGSLPLSGGVNYRIFQNYGRTAGSNLFHSFSKFNISLGQAATFEGSAGIDNIFARVTGGEGSTINGLLFSAVPSANLWLINPNGVLFGPHASINVDGSFYVSTANYLKFSDGFSFGSNATAEPILTTSAPEAFGFLGPHPASITFEGSGSDTVLNTPHPIAISAREFLSGYYASYGLTWNDMKVSSGNTFAIVGGDIEVKDGQLNNGTPVATRLQAPGGRLELVSVASAGEVHPNAQQVDTTAFANAGNIDINSSSQGALFTASGGGGGEIIIRGGELTLNNAYLVSDTTGNTPGKTIDIKVRDGVSINGNGAGIYARSFGAGKAVDINFESGSLALSNQATIKSGAAGSGDSGDISLRASTLSVASGSSIVGVNGSGSSGRGGDVLIDAETIQLAQASQVLSHTAGSGDGGNISIQADSLNVASGSSIVSNKENFSTGQGGDVAINAKTINLSNVSQIGSYTGDFSSNQGGSIDIEAEQMTIRGGSAVQSGSGSFGSATGGAITLQISGGLTIENGAGIGTTGTFSNAVDGNAGPIIFHVGTLVMRNGAVVGGDTLGSGTGAEINISADSISLESNSNNVESRALISSKAGGFLPSGAPGQVIITADSVSFDGPYSGISTISTNSNKAGSINIAAEKINLNAGLITSQTLGAGEAGNIDLQADEVQITQGARVKSDNLMLNAPGNAGSIRIVANRLINIDDESQVLTSTASEGTAGSISLISNQAIQVSDASVISSSSDYFAHAGQTQQQIGNKGAAGDVNLTANRIAISNAATIGAETNDGRGGKMTINTEDFSLQQGGGVSTSSHGRGQAGNIRIEGQNDPSASRVSIDGVRDDLSFTLPDGRQVQGQASGIYLNTAGSGNGGSLDLNSDILEISDGGLISAVSAFGATPDTRGGDINIQAGSIALSGGGLISAATSGAGDAGNVHVHAISPITITGRFEHARHPTVTNPRISDNSGFNSSASYALDNRTQELGAGGSVVVKARSLRLENGGEISVANEGDAAESIGGSIDIDAGQRLVVNGGRISAQTASARGGDITLKAQKMIHLIDSSISTSVAGGSGSGGNIFIDPEFVILDNSRITAQALRGAGGNIRIVADQFIQSPDSIVSASSQFGVEGNVVISSPDTNMIGKTAALATKFLDPASLFKQQCAARYAAGLSTLALQVSDAIKPAPGEALLTAPYNSHAGSSVESDASGATTCSSSDQ